MKTKLVTATRRLQWCMGHRLMNHGGKCAHLHGHNYVGHFEAAGPQDAVGRVIDFAVLKERIGGWIEDTWDHGFILNQQDDRGRAAMQAFDTLGWAGDRAEGKVSYVPYNPTAENLARDLLVRICPLVLQGTNIHVQRVKLWETENCYAVAELTSADLEIATCP